MANMVVSPSAATKLKNKTCANRMKHGSPKLQEVLRQRCRERMRVQRTKLFNRHRFGLELNCKHVQDTLTEIVREEFSNLSTTGWKEPGFDSTASINEVLTPEQALEIENEILAEEEQWILQEYERMCQEEEESLIDGVQDIVICPICQKCSLTEGIQCVICKMCDTTFSNCNNLKQMDHLISRSVNNHAQICNEVPGFMLFPENCNTCLYIMCQTCSTLDLVI